MRGSTNDLYRPENNSDDLHRAGRRVVRRLARQFVASVPSGLPSGFNPEDTLAHHGQNPVRIWRSGVSDFSPKRQKMYNYMILLALI